MKRTYLIPVLLLITALFACRKEAKLQATPEQPAYTLPQGHTAADDSIIAIHKKYGTYVLYRFSQGDFGYDYTTLRKDSAFNANPAYVDTTLRFFRQQLMALYPESFLKKTMPFRVLLAAYIGSGNSRHADGFASTSGTLTIGWADSTLLGKTPAELKNMRGLLHYYYWERAIRTEAVVVPPAFMALTPAAGYNNIHAGNRYAEGVVSDVYEKLLNPARDYISFIRVIAGTSAETLEAGIFRPQVDKKGLLRKKYNVVISHLKSTYGIDLQAIGNLP
ncbi:hypothetical protein ECE50_004235 [Chitinophaga sp. Mgbs1]|uniref:Uncharacterized protein n=1 Tax=Chitinophaga solisilvae TaxID=1233460 RepID=A0A3S1B261_9BACT|nr:hypothetical protein [Chitinophaga solisilvae]